MRSARSACSDAVGPSRRRHHVISIPGSLGPRGLPAAFHFPCVEMDGSFSDDHGNTDETRARSTPFGDAGGYSARIVGEQRSRPASFKTDDAPFVVEGPQAAWHNGLVDRGRSPIPDSISLTA